MTIKDGQPVNLDSSEFIKRAPDDLVRALSRHQMQKLGLTYSRGYLVLPTAAQLLDSSNDDRSVHVLGPDLQHIRWITMAAAFKL